MINRKCLGLLLLSSCLSFACKSKKTTPAPQSADPQAQLLKSDAWQGAEDQIDPEIGKIKTLD